MQSEAPKNAITLRLDKLLGQWAEFSQLPQARIGRWLVASDEPQMIDVFYETESTENGELPDLFLKFETPFTNVQQYGHDLFTTLRQMIDDDREAMREEGITLNFQPLPVDRNLPGTLLFLNNLANLAGSIEDLEGKLVAFLSPDKNDNIKQWKQWLIEAIELGIPANLRIMVVDAESQPVFDELAQQYPEHCITLQPNLDMASAMKQLASVGNPGDPSVQFRQAFLALTQAAGTGNLKEVQQLASKALNIAEKQNWLPMQVTVLATLGGTYLGAQQFDQAFDIYGKGLQVAKQAWEAGEPSGGKLAIQAYFSQGATMIAAKKYPDAAAVYEQAVPVAEKIPDYFNLMEAWRMAGYCHEVSKKYEQAWDCNHLALDAGEKLDEETRASSALPYVGQALQRLAKKMGRSKEQAAIFHRMADLVGENWQDKL